MALPRNLHGLRFSVSSLLLDILDAAEEPDGLWHVAELYGVLSAKALEVEHEQEHEEVRQEEEVHWQAGMPSLRATRSISAPMECYSSTKRSVSMVAPMGRSPSRTAGGTDGKPKLATSTAPIHRAPLLEVRVDKWGLDVIGRGRWQ